MFSLGFMIVYFMRHGEAESNVKGFINSDPKVNNMLTKKGQGQVLKSAGKSLWICMLCFGPAARAFPILATKPGRY